MTVGLHIAFYLDMPIWLEASGFVTAQQWMLLNEYLNFTCSVGIH